MDIKKIIREELNKIINEDKAYSQSTNNELAAYIIELSRELTAAKSNNDESLINSLSKDIEEVKQELSSRKIK